MNISNIQNDIIYNINYYQNIFITTFNKIINNRTGEIFTPSVENNTYYIFINNCYKVIFNIDNKKWFLSNNTSFNIIYENYNLFELLNHYLFITNRLTLCVLDNNVNNLDIDMDMDMDMEELNNKLKNTYI